MKYETILKLPDSKEKLHKLERKLLKLQPHNETFFKAKSEWSRLYDLYHNTDRRDEHDRKIEFENRV